MEGSGIDVRGTGWVEGWVDDVTGDGGLLSWIELMAALRCLTSSRRSATSSSLSDALGALAALVQGRWRSCLGPRGGKSFVVGTGGLGFGTVRRRGSGVLALHEPVPRLLLRSRFTPDDLEIIAKSPICWTMKLTVTLIAFAIVGVLLH
ncbi:hypothetical protein MTO96_037489, partial [Rhipicephalus appendiculatus]